MGLGACVYPTARNHPTLMQPVPPHLRAGRTWGACQWTGLLTVLYLDPDTTTHNVAVAPILCCLQDLESRAAIVGPNGECWTLQQKPSSRTHPQASHTASSTQPTGVQPVCLAVWRANIPTVPDCCCCCCIAAAIIAAAGMLLLLLQVLASRRCWG